MGSKALTIGLAMMVSVGSLHAESASYEGSLSGPALSVAGWEWSSPETTVSWVVDDITTPGKWHYWYEVTVPQRPDPWAFVQCVIIETTGPDPGPAFTEANLFSPSAQPEGWYQGHEIGWHEPDTYERPGLPEEVYGIQFCSDRDPLTVTISFDSDRGPRWGDFYATSGIVSYFRPDIYNTLYNAGFESPDPTDAPRDGSVNYHVLVPDAIPSVVVIPAPGAVLLGGIGAVLTGLSRRKRWLR